MLRTAKRSLLLIVALLVLINISGCEGNIRQSEDPLRVGQAEATAKPQTPAPQPTPSPEPSPTLAATPVPTPSPTVPPVSLEKLQEADKLYEQGYTLYNEFKYDEAIKYFNMSIEANPKNYMAYNGKGIALCFQGSYKTGMELIQKALDMKPDFAYANFNMAMAYKLQKDLDNALLWFEKALSYDPKDPWSYYGISTIYADRDHIDKSLEFLKKAIELDPAVKDVAKGQDHYARMRNNPEFVKLVN